VPQRLPVIEADPDRLAQVVGNLLSNAIKYTPAGGQVVVTAGVEGQEFWLSVADNGPGIASEEQQRVFDKAQARKTKKIHEARERAEAAD
jgi:signal transduction histidine kinase